MSRFFAWACVLICVSVAWVCAWRIIKAVRREIGQRTKPDEDDDSDMYLPRIQRVYGEWLVCKMSKQDSGDGGGFGYELESLETQDVVFAKQKAAALCGVSVNSVVVEL